MSTNTHSFDSAVAHQYAPVAPSRRILDVVASWPGVTAGVGGRGELAIRVGRREIGHLHGDGAAHFGFPRHMWISLYQQGRIERHPMFPDLVGPAAHRIQSESDVQAVIELFRLNYDRLTAFARTRAAGSGTL